MLFVRIKDLSCMALLDDVVLEDIKVICAFWGVEVFLVYGVEVLRVVVMRLCPV